MPFGYKIFYLIHNYMKRTLQREDDLELFMSMHLQFYSLPACMLDEYLFLCSKSNFSYVFFLFFIHWRKMSIIWHNLQIAYKINSLFLQPKINT